MQYVVGKKCYLQGRFRSIALTKKTLTFPITKTVKTKRHFHTSTKWLLEKKMLAFLHSSVQRLNRWIMEKNNNKKTCSWRQICEKKNDHSLTDNGLVLIVQNHMVCSVLEWLYYNVTCIVWNSVHCRCSRVTDSRWWA